MQEEKIGDSDLLEIWHGFLPDGRQHFTMHQLIQLDERARLVVEFVKAWGHAQITGNSLSELADQPHKRASRPTIEGLVTIAADTVQTLYEEIDRRGWTVKIPSLAKTQGDQYG